MKTLFLTLKPAPYPILPPNSSSAFLGSRQPRIPSRSGQRYRTACIPRLLFLPVSGPQGASEFYRSLTLAEAVRQRWPQAEIGLVINRQARGYAAQLESVQGG
jgi:hypothetical protein